MYKLFRIQQLNPTKVKRLPMKLERHLLMREFYQTEKMKKRKTKMKKIKEVQRSRTKIKEKRKKKIMKLRKRSFEDLKEPTWMGYCRGFLAVSAVT